MTSGPLAGRKKRREEAAGQVGATALAGAGGWACCNGRNKNKTTGSRQSGAEECFAPRAHLAQACASRSSHEPKNQTRHSSAYWKCLALSRARYRPRRERGGQARSAQVSCGLHKAAIGVESFQTSPRRERRFPGASPRSTPARSSGPACQGSLQPAHLFRLQAGSLQTRQAWPCTCLWQRRHSGGT